MWKNFNVYGTVIDVLVPTKRAKNGNHFGFARFKEVVDVEALWKCLREMRVGN